MKNLDFKTKYTFAIRYYFSHNLRTNLEYNVYNMVVYLFFPLMTENGDEIDSLMKINYFF